MGGSNGRNAGGAALPAQTEQAAGEHLDTPVRPPPLRATSQARRRQERQVAVVVPIARVRAPYQRCSVWSRSAPK